MAKDRLTNVKVTKARPGKKIKVLADGEGLRLLIHPNGSKYWQLRFTIAGKESSMQLGKFPDDLSLAEARLARDEKRKEAKAGLSPVLQRKLRRRERQQAEQQTFGVVADAWLDHGGNHPNHRTGRVWSLTHIQRNKSLLDNYLRPELGELPIQDISENLIRSVLEAAYSNGKRESARRAAAIASQIFTYAKERKLFEGHNPASELLALSTLAKPKVKHFDALNRKQVGPMLRKLAKSKIHPVIKDALLLMMHTGLRDYALRGSQWKEVDIEAATWTVPASRMKRGEAHTVPLPKQSIKALKRLKKNTYSGKNSFVFASDASKYGHIAENSLRLALHGLGYKVTAHGMRTLITNVLNESGFNRDAIERQLDHVEKNQVRAAYLTSNFMEQRVEMMQWLADWMEAQQANTDEPAMPDNVVQFRRAA